MVKDLPTNAGDTGWVPGPGRSPGVRNGNPLQYSCQGNAMDRGAWQAMSMWSRSRTQLELLSTRMHPCFVILCYFLPYSEVDQLCVDTHLLCFGFPPHLGHHRALGRVSWEGVFEKETGACSCAGRVRWKGCTIARSVIKAPWVEGGQWPWAGLDQFSSSWDLTSSLCSFPTQASKVTSLWFCVKTVPQRAIDLEHLIGFLSCIH